MRRKTVIIYKNKTKTSRSTFNLIRLKELISDDVDHIMMHDDESCIIIYTKNMSVNAIYLKYEITSKNLNKLENNLKNIFPNHNIKIQTNTINDIRKLINDNINESFNFDIRIFQKYMDLKISILLNNQRYYINYGYNLNKSNLNQINKYLGSLKSILNYLKNEKLLSRLSDFIIVLKNNRIELNKIFNKTLMSEFINKILSFTNDEFQIMMDNINQINSENNYFKSIISMSNHNSVFKTNNIFIKKRNGNMNITFYNMGIVCKNKQQFNIIENIFKYFNNIEYQDLITQIELKKLKIT